MELMILGLALFFAPHLTPTIPAARNRLIAVIGMMPYKGIVALISLAGLALVAVGKGNAPFIPVWEPLSWSYMVTNLCMLLALFCLVSYRMPSNLNRFTAHPMLWGIVLWSGGHLFTNGDRASMLLFGSFFVYSLVDMYSANRRGARPSDQSMPFRHDAMNAVISTVLYVLIANLHPYFTGFELVR